MFNRRQLGFLFLSIIAVFRFPSQVSAAEIIPKKLNKAALETLQGKKLRVVKQGDIITQDFSTDRLNLEIDDKSRIFRAWIG
ncbi:MAG: I78 family peptidase inhibitor [Alphaproteobacteria bacterium]